MRELEVIAAIEALLDPQESSPNVIRSVGDDAAGVRSRGYAVTSTDMMDEGVHFRSGQLTPQEIGHRSLAAALSDLAAMGACAGEAYLALGLPSGYKHDAALELVEGARAVADNFEVAIAGGDITRAQSLTVCIPAAAWPQIPADLW